MVDFEYNYFSLTNTWIIKYEHNVCVNKTYKFKVLGLLASIKLKRTVGEWDKLLLFKKPTASTRCL